MNYLEFWCFARYSDGGGVICVDDTTPSLSETYVLHNAGAYNLKCIAVNILQISKQMRMFN